MQLKGPSGDRTRATETATLDRLIHSFIHSLIRTSLSITVLLDFMAKQISLPIHTYCIPGTEFGTILRFGSEQSTTQILLTQRSSTSGPTTKFGMTPGPNPSSVESREEDPSPLRQVDLVPTYGLAALCSLNTPRPSWLFPHRPHARHLPCMACSLLFKTALGYRCYCLFW